jgi:hypothetical protein
MVTADIMLTGGTVTASTLFAGPGTKNINKKTPESI